MALGKRLKPDPPSPAVFVGNVRVTPETLTMEEANERMRRQGAACPLVEGCDRRALRAERGSRAHGAIVATGVAKGHGG